MKNGFLGISLKRRRRPPFFIFDISEARGPLHNRMRSVEIGIASSEKMGSFAGGV